MHLLKGQKGVGAATLKRIKHLLAVLGINLLSLLEGWGAKQDAHRRSRRRDAPSIARGHVRHVCAKRVSANRVFWQKLGKALDEVVARLQLLLRLLLLCILVLLLELLPASPVRLSCKELMKCEGNNFDAEQSLRR